jgi:hypothetical protein
MCVAATGRASDIICKEVLVLLLLFKPLSRYGGGGARTTTSPRPNCAAHVDIELLVRTRISAVTNAAMSCSHEAERQRKC